MPAEFDFRYATSETSDYDGFRERWLAAGGQQLLDDAEAQFRNFGLIKYSPTGRAGLADAAAPPHVYVDDRPGSSFDRSGSRRRRGGCTQSST